MNEKSGFNPTFQRIILCGRLAKDPVIKFLPSGKAVCNFGLVINRENGSKESDYVPCVAWENKAKIIADNCKRGSLILVEGRLKSSVYKDSEEKDRFELQFEVAANGQLTFMNNKNERNDHSSESAEV
ncbi:single-stranded DNA-binding protein [Bacillus subtilis]|uniref:single-stranded DNA-binding protein n=1 Tax=Bacillus subtilis TaxID=1423 RepID=UPI001B987BA2|nr:single-stranded DNA-binding protein [Bacillus subtilis]CAI6330673.1 Single-stranded DNA-binding protein [Bacillus subtilis]